MSGYSKSILNRRKDSGLGVSTKLPIDVLPHGMMPVAVIAMLIAVFWGILTFMQDGLPLHAGSQDALNAYKVDEEQLKQYRPKNGEEEIAVRLRQTFDQKLSDYKDNLDAFKSNLEYQGVLIVVALLLILRRSNTLSIFGNGVPLQWLHMLVPAVLLYFWLSFGFIFDDLIESRIRLVQMMHDLKADDIVLAGSMLHDAHFIDGWFLMFVDSAKEGIGDWSFINRNSVEGTGRFLALFLGTWLAVSHASTLAIVAIGARRYMPGTAQQRRRWYYLFPLIPAAVFLLSHQQFAYGGHNRNWLQLYIAIATTAVFGLLILLSLAVDQRVDRKSLTCLKRERGAWAPQADRRRSAAVHDLRARIRVLLMGDSLSTRFFVSNPASMVYRCWRRWRGSWFISGKREPFEGIDQRAGKMAYCLFRNAASATANIRATGSRTVTDWITHTFQFAHQIDEMEAEAAPDIVAVWIGHNAIDWRESDLPIESLLDEFEAAFASHLARLCAVLSDERKPRTLIVFGLINFQSFFEARVQCEAAREADSKLYPALDRCYRYFESLRPAYREQTVSFAMSCNERINKTVEQFANRAPETLRVVFSDALATVDISERECLNHVDAWHPSALGHERLAEAAWPVFEEAIRWVQERWEPDPAPMNQLPSQQVG